MAPFDISIIAQIQPAPPTNPLIDKVGEHIIYIGIGLMAVVIVIIIGLFSRRLEAAILFALALSAFIAVLVIAT